MTLEQFTDMRSTLGTIACLCEAHMALRPTDLATIAGVIQELADFVGGPRKLELLSDIELYGFVEGFSSGMKDAAAIKAEWAV